MLVKFPTDSTPSQLDVSLPSPYGPEDVDTDATLSGLKEGDAILIIDATNVPLSDLHIPNPTAEHPVRVATVQRTTTEGPDTRVRASILLPDGSEEDCVISTRDVALDKKRRYHFVGRLTDTNLIAPTGIGDVSFPDGHDATQQSSRV